MYSLTCFATDAADAVDVVEEVITIGAEEAEAEYVPAGPETFFVFFPTDIHRPSMKTDKDVVVKKVVVKVQY